MMRWLLYAAMGFFLANSAAHAQQHDFRNTSWGIYQNEIRLSEKTKPVCDNCRKDGQIIYETSVMAKKMALLYDTIEDKLVSAGYILTENYTNENKYKLLIPRDVCSFLSLYRKCNSWGATYEN